MPIYEFYCPDCHTVFSFYSRRINTTGRPACPRCGRKRLSREVSAFATIGRAGEDKEIGADAPVDEARMERAVSELASEADRINEDDPRQAARLMRKFSGMTGMEYGEGMQAALDRLEAGEDPETIERDMGDLMEQEDPFVLPGGRKSGTARCGRRRAPARDGTLYEM